MSQFWLSEFANWPNRISEILKKVLFFIQPFLSQKLMVLVQGHHDLYTNLSNWPSLKIFKGSTGAQCLFSFWLNTSYFIILPYPFRTCCLYQLSLAVQLPKCLGKNHTSINLFSIHVISTSLFHVQDIHAGSGQRPE